MIRRLSLLFLASIVLASCSLTKEDLGLKRTSPDASVVQTRKPLDLPPDFDTLPD